MHRTSIHIRRLLASIMLVAFASFVLHGSAMARPTAVHPPTGVSPHEPADAAHGGGSARQAHAADGHHHDTDAPDHHGAEAACCGSFCATAIAPFARDAATLRVETSVAVPVLKADGTGLAPDSPTKPPRTPDIA